MHFQVQYLQREQRRLFTNLASQGGQLGKNRAAIRIINS